MKRNQFVLLLVIFTISLTSCKSNGIVREITSVTDTDTAETTILSETSELLPDIPDITFDGYKIVFFVRGEEDNEWQSREIYAETENGEPINDAVYTRNLYLEEKYDVKIAQRETSDIAGAASKEISAGDANFDVIMERLYSTANLLSRGGFIADLNDLSYIDVSKP